VQLVKQIYASNTHYQAFATINSNWMSLVQPDGALELYDGNLRARDADGGLIFDQLPCTDYHQHIHEEVRAWSYMKFPFIVSRGIQDGWYRVGPLARVNNCDYINTPLAEAERQLFKADGIKQSTLAYHWARMIEALHAAESIRDLLHDPDILGTDLQAYGERTREGIGVIEAPRGVLIHHYQIDDNDLISKANLIVATTHNNQAMNESIRQVAEHYLDGQELTEPLLNQIEVAVRAYDPCLSCATHALGKMPLHIELLNAQGEKVDEIYKNGHGEISRHA
jgi:NAD-reducing hydrogenase large subunit